MVSLFEISSLILINYGFFIKKLKFIKYKNYKLRVKAIYKCWAWHKFKKMISYCVIFTDNKQFVLKLTVICYFLFIFILSAFLSKYTCINVSIFRTQPFCVDSLKSISNIHTVFCQKYIYHTNLHGQMFWPWRTPWFFAFRILS